MTLSGSPQLGGHSRQSRRMAPGQSTKRSGPRRHPYSQRQQRSNAVVRGVTAWRRSGAPKSWTSSIVAGFGGTADHRVGDPTGPMETARMMAISVRPAMAKNAKETQLSGGPGLAEASSQLTHHKAGS